MGHGRYIDPFGDARSLPGMTGGIMAEADRPSHYEVPEGQTLDLSFVVLPGESRNIDVAIDLTGPGAAVTLKALYLSGADETVRIRTLVHHRSPGCKSTQLICGIAGGHARVKFEGVIVVAPDAQQTEAYQENHNILLSPTADVETLPQLEIYADDVKCSHGATVGSLDPEARFYMRSRGIPEDEARFLQMLSFLTPVIPAGREADITAALRKLL